MARRARPPRRCSRRSRGRPRPMCSNPRAWSLRDRERSLNAVSVKALFFDVFGTLVDWRAGIAREAERILKPRGHALDWFAFADAWRDEYQPGMEEVRTGRIPFSKLDVLHRRNLERILPRFGFTGLSEEITAHLNRGWHRIDGWADVAPGLHQLKRKFLLAPVSNGNISLMV